MPHNLLHRWELPQNKGWRLAARRPSSSLHADCPHTQGRGLSRGSDCFPVSHHLRLTPTWPEATPQGTSTTAESCHLRGPRSQDGLRTS